MNLFFSGVKKYIRPCLTDIIRTMAFTVLRGTRLIFSGKQLVIVQILNHARMLDTVKQQIFHAEFFNLNYSGTHVHL